MITLDNYTPTLDNTTQVDITINYTGFTNPDEDVDTTTATQSWSVNAALPFPSTRSRNLASIDSAIAKLQEIREWL